MENTGNIKGFVNFTEKFAELKSRWKSTPDPKKAAVIKPLKQEKNNMENTENTHGQAKICPFMSTPDKDRTCTAKCKLYRTGKTGFECTFFAIQSISWNMKNGNNGANKPRY